MIENTFCPYCDELMDFEFSDDYYMTEQNQEADTSICPLCKNVVSVSWEIKHIININKRND